jgi:hypothetical protein
MNSSFQEFQTTSPVRPPTQVSEKIFSQVFQELNPSPWKIFSKVSLIHFIVGVLTLAVCPQFEIQILDHSGGLMHLFMKFGPYGCMMACGGFFLGTSMIATATLLRPEELRQLKKNSFLQISSLILLSLGFFIMSRTEILFGYAIAWVFGSLMTSLTLLEVIFLIRIREFKPH